MSASPVARVGQRIHFLLQLIRDFIVLLVRGFQDDRCRDSAGALTYTTLFAIVPVMTVAFAIMSAIPALQAKASEIQSWVFTNFAPGAGDQVLEHIGEFARQAGNLTGIGVAVLAVTAILTLRNIEICMNRIWRVQTHRSLIASLMMYWSILTLGPMCLGIGLGISSYVATQSLFTDAVEMLGGMRFWLALLPLIFTTIMMTLLYVVVPNCVVPLREGLIGGFVAAIFFELAKYGFTLFIKLSPSYQVVYGAFAAVPLFLLWIFISWNIVLGGAELVRALVTFNDTRSSTPHLQSLLRVLEVLWQRQQSGRVMRVASVRRLLRRVGASHWEEFRNLLLEHNLIGITDNGDYMLSRDLGAFTLAELVSLLPWPVERALAIGESWDRPWEEEVAGRLQEAHRGLTGPLDIPLTRLFSMEEEGGALA